MRLLTENQKITTDVLLEFEADASSSGWKLQGGSDSDLSCQNYHFADPHIIGAIIAHGIYRMYGGDFDLLAPVSLAWLDALQKKDFSTATNAREIFRRS